MIANFAEALSVKIKCRDIEDGSGFVVRTRNSSEIYILTAKHCLWGKDFKAGEPLLEDLRIFFSGTTKGDTNTTEKKTEYEYQPNSDSEDKIVSSTNEEDIAIIILKKRNLRGVSFKKTLQVLHSNLLNVYDICYFRGFPSKVGKGSGILEDGTWSGSRDKTNQFFLNVKNKSSHHLDNDSYWEGFSGSGIIVEKSKQIFLIGIFQEYFDSKGVYHSLDNINELLKTHRTIEVIYSDPKFEFERLTEDGNLDANLLPFSIKSLSYIEFAFIVQTTMSIVEQFIPIGGESDFQIYKAGGELIVICNEIKRDNIHYLSEKINNLILEKGPFKKKKIFYKNSFSRVRSIFTEFETFNAKKITSLIYSALARTSNRKKRVILNYFINQSKYNFETEDIDGEDFRSIESLSLSYSNSDSSELLKMYQDIEDDPREVVQFLRRILTPKENLTIAEADNLKEYLEEQVKSTSNFMTILILIYLNRILQNKIEKNEIQQLNILLVKGKDPLIHNDENTIERTLYRIIKYISINYSIVAKSDEFTSLLINLLERNSIFWFPRIANFYLKSRMNKVILNKRVVVKLKEYFQYSIGLNTPNSKFQLKALEYVTLPLDQIKKRFKSKRKLFSEIEYQIKSSTNSYQCNWLLSIYRHYAMFFTSENESFLDRMENDLKLLNAIKRNILAGSSSLLFKKMKVLLNIYALKLDNVEPLNEFEKIYLKYYYKLNIYYISRLQLDYALALYKILSMKKDKPEEFSRFYSENLDWQEAYKSFPLLYNPSLDGCEAVFPKAITSRFKRITFLESMVEYIRLQFNTNFRKQIENNFMYSSRIRALNAIPDFNQEFKEVVKSSYEEFKEINASLSPDFYCRIFTVLGSVNYFIKGKRPMDFLKKALKADEMVVIKNASGIFRFLSRMDRYYNFDGKNAVDRKAFVKLYKKAVKIVNNPITKDLYFWVYINAIKFTFDSDNFRFLENMYKKFEENETLYLDDSRGIKIPITEIQRTCDNFIDKASFATTCRQYVDYSEFWNFIGTLINDKYNEDEIPSSDSYYLKMAATFYSVAVTLSKNNLFYDQKYAFNYIHTTSTYMLKDNTFDVDYLLTTINFLRNRNNTDFEYAKERTAPFFYLLNKHIFDFRTEELRKLLEYVKNPIRNRITNNNWLKDEILTKHYKNILKVIYNS